MFLSPQIYEADDIDFRQELSPCVISQFLSRSTLLDYLTIPSSCSPEADWATDHNFSVNLVRLIHNDIVNALFIIKATFRSRYSKLISENCSMMFYGVGVLTCFDTLQGLVYLAYKPFHT